MKEFSDFITEQEKNAILPNLKTYGSQAEAMILNIAGKALNIQINNHSIMKNKYSVYSFPLIQGYKPDFQISLFFRPGHYDLCYQKNWPNLEE